MMEDILRTVQLNGDVHRCDTTQVCGARGTGTHLGEVFEKINNT